MHREAFERKDSPLSSAAAPAVLARPSALPQPYPETSQPADSNRAEARLATTHSSWWLAAAYLFGVGVLLLGIEPAVYSRLAWDACNNFDLGIYSRALYLITWDDLNPWLTNRATKIFNDHFDPVLLLVAPWVKLGEPARIAIAIEALIVVAAGLPMLWLYRRGAGSATLAATAILYLLLNRATISAVDFPVHPTTWAMLPATWLGAALLMDRKGHVLAALTLLFACKEEFPFLGAMLALYYLQQRQWRFASVVGVWSALWIAGTLVVRPLLLGEVQHHASHRFVDLSDPLTGLAAALGEVDWKRLAQVTLPLAPLAGWLLYQRRGPNWALWLLPAPLVLIRFLAGAWTSHYLAPLAPLWLLGLVPRGGERFPRGLVIVTALLLLAVDWGPLRRARETITRPAAIAWAPHDPARRMSIAKGREYLLAHREGKALVQSNLIPRLVRRPELYQIGGSHDPQAHEFQYVFVERPPHGDPWPITAEDFQRLLTAWRGDARTRVIIDDGQVFLAEGQFRDKPR